MPEFGRLPQDYLSVKVTDGKISRKDADIILKFLNEEANVAGHTPHTILSNCRYIAHAVEHLPDIKEWTNDKINQYISESRKSNKPNTVRKRVILTKKFCEWLLKRRLNTILDLPSIKEIKAPAADRLTKRASQMLSTDEIDRIVAAGSNTRDRCLLAMLSETGMRPFEVLRLTWGELKIDEYGVIINTSGKTGAPRFVRIVHATPYIAAWKNDHPFPNDKAYIFTSLKTPNPDVKITHSALKKIVRLSAIRSKVKKHVNPYLFRHSNVSRMLEEGYSDSTIRMIHWGSQTTQMLGTYGHVSAQAIDNEILGKSGVVSLKQKEQKKVHQCQYCQTILTPTMEFCPSCGKPVSESAQAKLDLATKRIREMMSEDDFLAVAREMYRQRAHPSK